jgi:hypothetical protein
MLFKAILTPRRAKVNKIFTGKIYSHIIRPARAIYTLQLRCATRARPTAA